MVGGGAPRPARTPRGLLLNKKRGQKRGEITELSPDADLHAEVAVLRREMAALQVEMAALKGGRG